MARVEITGEIIPNDYGWIYDWYGLENTTPDKIKNAIAEMKDGEQLEVWINSPGGDVASGQEIYSLLADVDSVAKITGFAASAAGFAAMGCRRVEMSPVAVIMIHNVWTQATGDYHEMETSAEMLKKLNKAIAAAVVARSGKSEEEILELMDSETWITTAEAIDIGICDGVIAPDNGKRLTFENSVCGLSITPEMIEKAKAAKAQEEETRRQQNKDREDILSDLYMFGTIN